MFGGPHRNDEGTRTEQVELERKNQNGDVGEVLASQSAHALANGCRWKSQKSFGISLDTADFVRHIPYPPNALRGESPATTLPGKKLKKVELHRAGRSARPRQRISRAGQFGVPCKTLKPLCLISRPPASKPDANGR